MFNKQKAAALAVVCPRNAHARQQVARALAQYPPADHDTALFDALTTDPVVCNYLPMSNFAVRYAAQEALIDAVLAHYARIRRCGETRNFFFTAAFDAGFTFVGGPIMDIAALQRKIVAALNRVGLNAICAFEVDVLSKTLRDDSSGFPEPSRRLMFHVHAIVWTRDASFKPIVSAHDLMKLRCFSNALGIPAINIESRAMSCARRNEPLNRPQQDQTATSMAAMARYMLKIPICAKNYVRASVERRGRLYDDAGAYGLNVALRMTELWSHIPAGNAVFGVSEGADIANAYRQQVRDWAAAQRAHASWLDRAEISDAWARLWNQYPDLGFWPPLIRQRGG